MIFVDSEVIFVDPEVRACFREPVTWLIVTSEFVRRSRTQLITRGQYSVPVIMALTYGHQATRNLRGEISISLLVCLEQDAVFVSISASFSHDG